MNRENLEYDRDRISRLFDEMPDTYSTTAQQGEKHAETVPQVVGRIAFERLALDSEDVLLDVGAGTGDRAIAAARICRRAIGLDISRKSLELAREKAAGQRLDNVTFAYGAFEEPSAEIGLGSQAITKILSVYALHHLPDRLKKESLAALSALLHRPGRIVIGDIMFSDDPNKHRQRFHEVNYDGGDLDFPSSVEFLVRCLRKAGAEPTVLQIHPLAGVIAADFV